jgi:hypothetical protein
VESVPIHPSSVHLEVVGAQGTAKLLSEVPRWRSNGLASWEAECHSGMLTRE